MPPRRRIVAARNAPPNPSCSLLPCRFFGEAMLKTRALMHSGYDGGVLPRVRRDYRARTRACERVAQAGACSGKECVRGAVAGGER